ncbi:MAG: AlpA family phage regulatory protein [Acidobacteria bacterium]|nr:AlpA family phage regulatory protein [Acidobacteriota bacterium]
MTTNRHTPPVQPSADTAMPRLLTLRDVTAATALSRSAVYALMAESRFPKPIRIGSRAVRWVESEVLDFITSRPRAGSDRPPRSQG